MSTRIGGQGWVDRPSMVAEMMELFHSEQKVSPYFAVAGSHLAGDDDDEDVFFWDFEERILGEVLPSWNQGSVGTCVSFGWGRGVQDLMLGEIVAGEPEEWPGDQVATEPIYGGSRVEIGGGRIGGDGSVGAWAAKWVKDYGILLRRVYGAHDLTRYSEQMSRDWGRRGIPDELEPIAREHPVQTVSMVKTAEEAWASIGSLYPIPICSNVGFTTTYDEGFCYPRGNWNHCMLIRARFTSPKKGKAFVIQNSWADYIKGSKKFKTKSGERTLPSGCFCATWDAVDRILRQGDSFAISDSAGYPRKKITWYL